MATLAEIRAKLQQQNNKTTSTGTGDNAIYPHWDIDEGQTASLRFLPDADPNNTFFWIERAMIKLPFNGVKGEANSKPVIVQVPCMEMWGESCPVLTEVRPWFKDKSLEEMGRKYWKKKSYLFQGFVVDSSMKEDKVPENPIRRFIISSQIFNIVKAALMDPDMLELPTDYSNGVDFKVLKTSKGGYADYSTSNWARRDRALSENELAAINQYGLFDLKSFLPKKPGPSELQAIKEMFEASVDGEAFDMERWGQFYKPSGYGYDRGGDADAASPAARPASPVGTVRKESEAPVRPTVNQPVDVDADIDDTTASTPVTPGVTASNRAQDILAMIRNRQKV